MILGLKPYPKVEDSGTPWLGNVPLGWPVLPLKRIGVFQSGAGFPISAQGHSSGDVLFAKVSDMNIPGNERYIHTSKNAVSREVARRLGAKIFGRNAIIFPKVGGALLTNKRRVLTKDTCIDNNLMACVVAGADSRFVYRMLSWLDLALLAKPGPVPAISEGEIREIRIALPSVEEQTAIARFLDHTDRRIQKYIRAKEKLIALLDEYKQALIHQAVTGQIDVRTGEPYPEYKESGVEWIGKMPSHWQRARLKALIQPIDIRSVDGKETLLSLRRDHGIVVYAEHFSRPPQGASLVGYKLVKPGHLVVNRLQANNGLIFCSALSGVVSPDYSVFEQRSEVQVRFLSELLRTRLFRTHFRKQATGLGTGTAGFLRLYDNDFLATPFCLPPLSEQTRIVAYIDHVVSQTESATERTSRSIGFFREYRTRLIADVVTGKLDVREAAAELPNMNATACGNGIDTMQAESNSHEPERRIAEEANP